MTLGKKNEFNKWTICVPQIKTIENSKDPFSYNAVKAFLTLRFPEIRKLKGCLKKHKAENTKVEMSSKIFDKESEGPNVQKSKRFYTKTTDF